MPRGSGRSNRSKTKGSAWFVPVRGSYLPASGAGWLTYLPFMAYLIFAAVVGWRDTATHGEAVLFVIPNWVAAGVVMTWLAKLKS